MNRFLIAFDTEGKSYLREIICVTHDENVDQAIYYSKPLKWTKRRLGLAIKRLNKIYIATNQPRPR